MSDINNLDSTKVRSVEYMLTTVDNPYDPFTKFDEWWAFDTQHGYNTAGFLARVVNSSDDLSEMDQHVAVQLAIDQIVSENVLGLYRKVTRATFGGQAQS